MDKLKGKGRSARSRLAGESSSSNPTATPQAPQAEDNSSTRAVNDVATGERAGATSARDFASSNEQPRQGQIVEPPTSLQSSIDAGAHVPTPSRYHDPLSLVSHSTLSAAAGRARSNSAPNRDAPQQQRRPPTGLRQHSISIRRVPSSNGLRQAAQQSAIPASRLNAPLPALDEDCALGQVPTATSELSPTEPSRLRKVRSAFQERIPFWAKKEPEQSPVPIAAAAPDNAMDNYTMDMVDVLDTIDPEVATLTSLTNMQNSLFIPNLPWFNRRPTYNFRRRPSETESLEEISAILGRAQAGQASERTTGQTPGQAQADAETREQARPQLPRQESGGTLATIATIDSHLSDSRYAVLPHGTSLEGWSREDKKEVNDHVRHMLHSKRSKFKRTMRGFGQYVRRPLGFLVTLYAFLITIFGLAWVLFLIGWIDVGGKQIYVIHIIDSVMVALFAIVGDGLAPFRAVDTYHMIFIAHYHHFTWSRRKKAKLPELDDHNDLPTENAPVAEPRPVDPEDPEKQWEFTVLTEKQQKKLEHHQEKFCKSHSFYKPHETETHHAFPLRLLVAIVVLLDCHSCLQISLGATTWGIYYKHRNPAITTVILIVSITCNATAGLLIWIGDKRTRKTDVLERMNRQELTEEAIEKVKKKKERESESEREDEGEKKERRGKSFDVIGKDTLKKFGSGPSGEKVPKAEQSAYP